MPDSSEQRELPGIAKPATVEGTFGLLVVLDAQMGGFQFEWRREDDGPMTALGRLTAVAATQGKRIVLNWAVEVAGVEAGEHCSGAPVALKAFLKRILLCLPLREAPFRLALRLAQPWGPFEPNRLHLLTYPGDRGFFALLEQLVVKYLRLAEEGRWLRSPGAQEAPLNMAMLQLIQSRVALPSAGAAKAPEHPNRPNESPGRATRSGSFVVRRKAPNGKAPNDAQPKTGDSHPPKETRRNLRPPSPPVSIRLEVPEFAVQETAFVLSDLRSYFLRERAARWWVSNQSDDLLALPYCRIEKLDYQIRTALRVIGPLRGRALLSDEVGLGKTIEAGLVLKEWLTRGMVKRFLILTVPSLVDQWEEELNDKFALTTATTNHAVFRSDPAAFWRTQSAIVASLATLKQPAHLEVARSVGWDLVVVDEAHHLRNRESQAWQAVNVLPRQFLLLLTATPVQNSLEELYNLVTLLQPGQLPSPKEFRARFMDPKRPRQPREPEELRRLLGQVMIRNTRANADLHLPPRHAETVLFQPADDEREFWQRWENELRSELSRLPAGQSSLWGRLLLQAAGSSPAAWREALLKFPASDIARTWRQDAPLVESWRRKCELLPTLTRGEGGLVVFTQFLATQAALAEALEGAGVKTFVIHGGTPAVERQPITELFRKSGGALLLTHCGTEGRNLQFCHRLVNFDLPWNPMEIEQRIGRLHRLGQQHPVRIYNLVQAGTLQEHLLEILQEKLNLFELVVGETGLVLGDRFGSDEFAEEVLRRWRESEGRVAEALQTLGRELAEARAGYQQVKQLDETLFAKDYETL